MRNITQLKFDNVTVQYLRCDSAIMHIMMVTVTMKIMTTTMVKNNDIDECGNDDGDDDDDILYYIILLYLTVPNSLLL